MKYDSDYFKYNCPMLYLKTTFNNKPLWVGVNGMMMPVLFQLHKGKIGWALDREISDIVRIYDVNKPWMNANWQNDYQARREILKRRITATGLLITIPRFRWIEEEEDVRDATGVYYVSDVNCSSIFKCEPFKTR